MTKTFALLFRLKPTKKLSNGKAPIYLRITIDRGRVEMATKRAVTPERWNAGAQKVSGNNEDARSINHHLKSLEQDAYRLYREMMENKVAITAQALKDRLNGVATVEDTPPRRLLLTIFKEHNRRMDALVGKDYAAATARRYETTLKHVADFLKWKYKVPDVNLQDLDHEFITSFDFYLRSVRRCNNNSTVKYIKNLKKVIHICVANSWLDRNPFINYKGKLKEVVREFLSSEELETLTEKRFGERLTHIRDVFVFCCYTGLAYVDVQKLKRSDINTGIDNHKWIFITRQKTNTASRVPLLPVALDILKKYENYPGVHEGRLLPVSTNQKMNAYLKEIADICGIEKELTFHIARHTFATTVTLANGVSIESVSKMLGHKNIRTTQHYAKILDSKVSDDMAQLRLKFESKRKLKKESVPGRGKKLAT